MPIEHAIWTVGEKPLPLKTSALPSEQLLEDMIVEEPPILSSEWMLIGRQEITPNAGRIDLLAIAPDASLVLIELKRDKTPRDIVAQALDYATWVEGLTSDRIAEIYRKFSNGENLSDAFRTRFDSELDEGELNQSHQIILCASQLDPATERIVTYLNERDIPINVLFFRVFQHGDAQFLSRAWMIDPGETQVNAVSSEKSKREKVPWNGEYYVSFGPPNLRSWTEAVKYGYISGGGGRWYSQTLKMLSPGNRVWVMIPKVGYVGVGIVAESIQHADAFTIQTEAGERPCLEVLEHAPQYRARGDDPEKAEFFVRIDWLDTVSEENAFREIGLFANQNTVCQPTTPKWERTLERLRAQFPKWDNANSS